MASTQQKYQLISERSIILETPYAGFIIVFFGCLLSELDSTVKKPKPENFWIIFRVSRYTTTYLNQPQLHSIFFPLCR